MLITYEIMNKLFYTLFAAQILLLPLSAIGLVSAQETEPPLTSAVTNLTNATSSPEDVKQMDVMGGTVNQTLNASEGAGMDNASSAGMNASSNMTMSSNMTGS